MKRTLATFLVLALTFLSAAAAQSLQGLLPAETLLAVGTQGLADHQDLLNDFIAEFDRLGVADAVQAALAGPEQQADLPDMSQLPAELQGVGFLDLFGDEAWLTVSASSSNPLPAITLVARVDAKAQDAVASMIEQNASNADVQQLTEGNITFYVETVTAPDTGGNGGGMPTSTPMAYAQDGALVVVSSNPDVLRGVLRRHQGASEPSFTGSDNYAATLGQLGDGNVYVYLDAAAGAGLIQPLLQGQGFDSVVTRLVNALDTIGARGSVTRVTDQGTESVAIQALNGGGKDVALYNLLVASTAASMDPLAFVPGTALSVQSGRVDLSGWWNYLGDLIASAPELGIGDLDQMITGMTGLDLRTSLFDWMGTSVATIVTDAPTVVQPGMPGANLLGDSVFLVEAADPAAASSGLGQLFSTLAAQLSAFTSPGDTAGAPAPATRDVGGVTVTSYTMGPGISLSYAVVDGYALIGTSDGSMDKVLTARSQGAQLPATLAAMRAKVPQDAVSFSLTDERASMEAGAATFVQGIQTAAGMGGSQGLDFDKVQAASDAVQQFLTFVASRMGGGVSYTQVQGGVSTSHSSTEISWH